MNTWKLLFEVVQLKRNERKSPAQLKKLQKKKLRRLLVYTFHHSSYHHRAFVRAGIDAEADPDRRPYKGKYHVVHSSGSTGRLGYCLFRVARL